MYHIAICDDDKRFITYIKSIIKQVKNNMQEIKIYEYTSGEELVYQLKGFVPYDLLILDMQLRGMDGDETARLFRNKFPDAVLVFCSGVRPPSVKSFKATPFRYLLKSFSDKEFLYEMKEIFGEMEKKSKDDFIVGHYRNNAMKIRIRNILYVENAKRGSRIVVDPKSEENKFEGLILVDEKLQELSEKFSQLHFAHSSYVVNINHVNYIRGNELFLDSGESMSISRMYQKSFREIFTKSVASKYK